MNPFVEQLGWVLVHSLWQFALVALLAGVTVRAQRRSSSALRYGVLVVAMAVSVAAPTATWMLMRGDVPAALASRVALALGQESIAATSPGADATRLANNPVLAGDTEIEGSTPILAPLSVASEPQSTASPLPAVNTQPTLSWTDRTKATLRPWLARIVVSWSFGVLACSLRPLLGWHTLRRLKRVGVLPASDDVLAAMRRVSERLGLHRAVRVLQSTLAQVPVVVGYVRPVILLPVSLMTSLPAEQLEAILAHELAHVRRHDFLVNLLQMLIETLFFYHPAVWWLSRQIRVEREHCCDDLVVAAFGNRIEYGRALLAIEELRGRSTVLALGAADGSLLSRIRRIVSLDSDHATNERWPAVFIGLAIIGATCALSMTWSLAAKDDEKIEPQPAIAKLPGDVIVELVGVTHHTSTSEPESSWWTPSGSPLAEGRIERKRFRGKSASENHRIFVVEVRGIAEALDVRVAISPAGSMKLGYFGSTGSTSRDVGRSDATNFTTAGPFIEANQTSVRVRLATDEWGPIQEVSTSAARINELQLKPEYARCYDNIGPQRVHEQVQKEAVLTIGWPRNQDDLAASEVWAVDKDGKRHEVNGTAGPLDRREFSFLLPLARVARFEYRLRPYRHWVTFENVSLQPGKQTDVKVMVESLPATDAEAMASRLDVVLKRQALLFLDEPRLRALQSELRDDFAKYSKTPLSDSRRETLLVGIDGFVAEHFRREEGDHIYLSFRDEFETLKWQLRIAASHAPLTDTELAQREQQRKWMVNAIEALPESPKFRITHKDELAKLGRLLSDPLNPFFAYSMSEPDFARFQKTFDERVDNTGAGKSLIYAVSWLTQAAIETQIELLLSEWPVKNRGWHRSNTRWSLIVVPTVGNSSLDLMDVNTNVRHVYADVLQNIFVNGDAPVDFNQRDEWLLKQPNGDLCFDAKLDLLVGVRGAKLAVLDAASWYEADRVPLADLRRLIETRGQASIPLSHFAEPKSPEGPYRRLKSHQPSLVVRTGSGRISVIRLRDVDSVVIVSRPRPLPPNPPLHPGDEPDEPSTAKDDPKQKQNVAELPGGVRLELCGVLNGNVTTPTAWRPDGTMIDVPKAWPELLRTRNEDPTHGFVFRATGLAKGQSLIWSKPGRWTTPVFGETVPEYTGISTSVANEGSLNIRVGITDVWGPWQRVEPNGEIKERAKVPDGYRAVYERVQSTRVFGGGSGTLKTGFVLEGIVETDDQAEYEVVAVGPRGARQKSRGGGIWKDSQIPYFEESIEQIDHFEFRLQPHRHWVTFENVSLQPEHKTEVKVKVESLPKTVIAAEETPKEYGPQDWAGWFANQVQYRKQQDGTYPAVAFKHLRKWVIDDLSGEPNAPGAAEARAWLEATAADKNWAEVDFKSVVERIGKWRLSVIQRALGNEENASKCFPKPGRPAKVDELRGFSFGPPAENGIRVAWVFDPAKKEYAVGETLKCRVIVHNSGSQPVQFLGLDIQDGDWSIRDATGNPIQTKHLPHSSVWMYPKYLPYQRYRLEPGHVVELSGQGVGIGEGDHSASKTQIAIWRIIHARAGDTVRISVETELGLTVGSGKSPFDEVHRDNFYSRDEFPEEKARDWSGSLRSGEVKFNVVAAVANELRPDTAISARKAEDDAREKRASLMLADEKPPIGAAAYVNVPMGRMPPLDKAMELEVFALRLRSIAPKDWIVERKDRAFRLRGPEVPARQERAEIQLWFDDVSIGSDDLNKRDKALPKIGALNNTRIGRHYFNRNKAAENLWPEFGFEVRLIEPTDQIAIAGTGVLESKVIGLAWSDAAFVRYVEISPDGRRRNQLLRLDGSAIGITPATKFLVLGELPDPALATNEADQESALRRDKTFNELKAEAARHGVKTISLAEFETYVQSVLKEGRGFRTRWIKDANQLQVPECLMTGHGLVEVKLVEPKQEAELPKTSLQAELGNEKNPAAATTQAERAINPQRGTLSGRFVYDGEPPAQTDLLPSFAKIDVSQPQQTGPDGRFNGVEGVYRDFLKHKIRPKTEDASLLVNKDGGIANVVVWVVNKDIPWSPPKGEQTPVTIRLKDGNFSPRFAAVTVGQPLLIENHDPVLLNFAAEFSRALNPSMTMMLPPGTENTPQRVTFRAPEPYPATYRSYLAPWAKGRVFVHGNPFVAVSQPDGSFTLPNLPTGDWEFQVWHERGGFLQHWPKGRFQQSIKPGDNKLGTIKLKPEHLGQKPAQAIATTTPPKNREQIGEVLGKPVYRDEVKDDTLNGIFLNPVLTKYRGAHSAAISPKEDEIKFATEFFDKQRRKQLDAAGGEAKIREQMKALEERLARTDLTENDEKKLELEHLGLRQKLRPPGRFFAEFMLNNWKFQKHLYDEFGGGRILFQQGGLEAFDATRTCLESLEKKGEFKITDAKLRVKLYEYWTRSHGSFLMDDKERIRKEFLEPEWIAPAAAKIP